MKLRTITLLALLCIILGAKAAPSKNGIVNGTVWTNSTIDYFVEVKADGSIEFTGCDEGQDMAFRLVQKPGKKDEYRLTDGKLEGAENPFCESSHVKQLRDDDIIYLCIYDDQERLRDVVNPLQVRTAMLEAQSKRETMLAGDYTSSKGVPMSIEWGKNLYFDGKPLRYSNTTFNSIITGVMEITGGTQMEGLWDVKLLPDGLKLSKVTSDEEYFRFFQPTGEVETFTWAQKDTPRFEFASKILLNGDQLRGMDKSLLRLMRNEILFHHGYVPTSEDLQAYLVDKQWYTPRESNDGIYDELSLIEKLNIDLIKSAESLKEEQ